MPKFRKTKRQRNQERLDKLNAQAHERKQQTRMAALTPKVESTKPDVYFPLKRWRPDAVEVPSKSNGVEPSRAFKPKERYEGEMAEREAAAQVELKRKSKRVAIAYSKGAYQYITDGTDPKEIGRKNPT